MPEIICNKGWCQHRVPSKTEWKKTEKDKTGSDTVVERSTHDASESKHRHSYSVNKVVIKAQKIKEMKIGIELTMNVEVG